MQPDRTDYDLTRYLQLRRARIDILLGSRLAAFGDRVPSRLLDAMRYSLTSGGKRLRPILCLGFAEAAGRASNAGGRVAEDAACALEFVHTDSLIHDDLPAM